MSKFPSAAGLHVYIEKNMPKTNSRGTTPGPDACVGQCAADVTAYLEGFRLAEVASCSATGDVTYSERSIRMLTGYEYKNSVRDLFAEAVPEEYLDAVEGSVRPANFPATLRSSMSFNIGDKYFQNAVKIADWGVASMACAGTDKMACADEFINGFAKKAFRRPLKTGPTEAENEVKHIQDIFAEAANVNVGMKWAIVGVLTSPNFLYRSELGVKASEALDNPLFSASGGGGTVVGDAADYEAAGAGVTVNGVDFTKSDGVGENSPDGSTIFKMYTNGTLTQSFAFTSPSILTLSVRGNDYNDTWPMMEVSVNGELMSLEEVVTPGYANEYISYNYLVSGVDGNADVVVRFANDASASGAMGAPGTDVDLHVAFANVAPAQLKQAGDEVTEEADFSDKLADAATDADAYVLDPYEYASVLSYMLTGSTPDEELLAAAGSGALNTKAGASAQMTRLLNSNKAERHMKYFVSQWMRTGHLASNPELDSTLVDSMVKELEEFFWHIFSSDDVPFSEFYTADYSFLNETLASHYGVTRSGGAANEFVKTPVPANRGGVVTMGAFMANWSHGTHSAPILRAVHVREDMLCQHFGKIPEFGENDSVRIDNLAKAQAIADMGELTSRQFYELATTSEGCNSCHLEQINPLGAGMEDYSGVGVYRNQQVALETENNLVDIVLDGAMLFEPLRANGTEMPIDISGGARDLSLELGALDSVQSCIAEKAFRMTTHRPISNSAAESHRFDVDSPLSATEREGFACASEVLSTTLKTTNQSPKEMFKALGNLDLIRFRR